MVTRLNFRDDVREALGNLHDPDRLYRSLLVNLFGLASSPDRYLALQSVLTESISALQPRRGVPANSRAWRIYELLLSRYVQELDVPTVANQLGVSPRHLRREQNAALDALCEHLWVRFHLQEDVVPEHEADGPADDVAHTFDELAWIKSTPLERPTVFEDELHSVLDLVRPLAVKHRTRLEIRAARPLPHVAVHPVALTQILLNLLSVTIHQAADTSLTVSTEARGWQIHVEIECATSGCVQIERSQHDEASLEVAQGLVDLCGGHLTLDLKPPHPVIRLALPTVQALPVLAIDDNADTLRLLQHYTTGTRYQLTGVRDPEAALASAGRIGARIILLDVMMPQLDGWQLLGRLRQDPATRNARIVVCTILPQEELALILGASAFLRKPVTQLALLRALDEQAGWLEPGYR